MARTVYPAGHWDGIDPDEQFTELDVRTAALELLTGPSEMIDSATIVVSAEWERDENELQRGPIDEKKGSRYFPQGDDLIVSIELRLPRWQRESEPGQQLEVAVRKTISQRQQARLEEQIAEAEAQEQAAQATLAQKRARLEALRAEV